MSESKTSVQDRVNEPFRPEEVEDAAEDSGAQKAAAESKDKAASKDERSAADSRQRDAFEREVAKGAFPRVHFVNAELPGPAGKGDGAEKKQNDVPRLEGEQLQRARQLQENLTKLLPKITTIPAGANAEAVQKAKTDLDDLAKRMDAERAEGTFGPASKEAYGRFIEWQKNRVPAAIVTMDRLGLPLPAGSPFQLPTDEYGRPIRTELFKNLVALNQTKFNPPSVDAGKVPSAAELRDIERSVDWLSDCQNKVDEAIAAKQREILVKVIGEKQLPEGWLKGQEKGADWIRSAGEMVDLATRTGNYIEAMHSMHKASANRDFPFKLPANSEVTIKIGDKEHTVKAGQEDAHSWILRDKSGTITNIKLDLPQDLRQDHPQNAAKIDRMEQWLRSPQCEKIEQALVQYLKLEQNSDGVIMYADQPVADTKDHDLQGRFNARGELLGIADAKAYRPKAGEHLRELNLLGYDFETKKTEDGQILVEQNIQGWNMPWYAYQDIRAFGDKVGEPMSFSKPVPADLKENYQQFEIKVDGQARTLYRNKSNSADVLELVNNGERVKEVKLFKPDDFVPVGDGGQIQIMKAKDLADFRSRKQLAYYGEKGLMIGLDAAMLVSGTIEVGAAIKGARLAASGLQAAGALTRTEVARELTKGGTRMLVAGSGIFNNSGAMQHEWGRNLNTARGLYFLADISHGLLRKGVGAGATAEKMHSIIYGTKGAETAVNSAEVLKGMGWVKHAHKASEWTFRAAEIGFVPVIAGDLSHQIKSIKELGTRDPLADAKVQVGDGRGLHATKPGAFDRAKPETLKATNEVLDGYAESLAAGREEKTQSAVRDIFAKTKELMNPNATEEQRAAYRKELLAQLTFSPAQIAELEKLRTVHTSDKDSSAVLAQRLHLSGDDLHKLIDPVRRAEVKPSQLRERAEAMLAEKNPDVRAAALMALTFLSRDENGKINNELAKVDISVPKYTRVITERQEKDQKKEKKDVIKVVDVMPHAVSDSLSMTEAIDALKRDLESKGNGVRGIALGDFLTRVGAVTHRQYAGVLQDVLLDPKSTKEEKMRALVDPSGARFASLIDGVRHEEQVAKEAGEDFGARSYGLSSKELIAILEGTASDTKNHDDVRAMAAGLLYGLTERDAERRAQILSSMNTIWQARAAAEKFDGSFAKQVREELLSADMRTAIPDQQGPNDKAPDIVREHKLAAALVLAKITKPDDVAMQREINQALARSVSGTDASVALLSVDALLPDRIKQLEQTDPDLANLARKSAVSHIKRPTTFDEEATTLAFIGRMDQLFNLDKAKTQMEVGKELLFNDLSARLSNFINPTNAAEYAKDSAPVRIAAIESLAKLGAADARPLIRQHIADLTGRPIRIGSQVLAPAENDARVRLAAVKALKDLKDVDFPGSVPQLMDSEKDPTVQSALREVRFLSVQIDPKSRQWKDIAENFKMNVTAAAKLDLDKFDYRKWLAEFSANGQAKSFDLLPKDAVGGTTCRGFMERNNQSVENSFAWYDRVNPFGAACKDMERDSVTKMEGQRNQQWTELLKLAGGNTAEAKQAKFALYEILNNGGILGEPGPIGRTKYDYKQDHYNPNWPRLAAEALYGLTSPGTPQKDVTSWIVRSALEQNRPGTGCPRETEKLVEAWSRLRDQGAVEREVYAGVLGLALVNQFTDPTRQKPDSKLVNTIIDKLEASRDRSIYPVFAEIAKQPNLDQGIRDRANRILEKFQYSTELMWSETNAAQSTPQQRADRVRAMLEQGKTAPGQELPHADAEKTVQEIFNAYKGVSISDEKNPGLPYLKMALSSDNERVSLAAARIIGESKLPASNEVKLDAMTKLLRLSESSTNPVYKREAAELIVAMKRNEFGDGTAHNVETLTHGVHWLRNLNRPQTDATTSANAIRSALDIKGSTMNDVELCDAIVSAFKSGPIKEEVDPRRSALQTAMRHSNDRVKLAAAWMLAESAVASDREAAMKALARVACDATQRTTAYEAQSLLTNIMWAGGDADRATAAKAWSDAYATRKNQNAFQPGPLPQNFERVTAYLHFASAADRRAILDQLSMEQKIDLAAMFNEGDRDWVMKQITPAKPIERTLPKMIDTRACHQQPQRDREFSLTNSALGREGMMEQIRKERADQNAALERIFFDRYCKTDGYAVWRPASGYSRPAVPKVELRK